LGEKRQFILGRALSDANELITVNVRTGDEVILGGEAAFPNIIEIDIEGHELGVVLGFSAALRDPRLRCVFVEVHFAILQERGMLAAPRQIEQTLIANGFRISWRADCRNELYEATNDN